MIEYFAVDVGYSSVKGAFESGETFGFPSTVEAYVDHGLIGMKNDFFVVDGKKRRVGQFAATLSNKRSTGEGHQFHGGADWKALMCRSFVELAQKEGLFNPEKPDNSSVVIELENLGLGIPFKDGTRDKAQALREACHFEFEFMGVPFKVEIGTVHIFQQGLAALALEGDLPPLVGFVDIGFYTIDVVLVQDGQISYDLSTSYSNGVAMLHRSLNAELISRFKVQNLGTKELNDVLSTKKFFVKGVDHDLSDLVSRLIEEFSEQVGVLLRSLWDKYTDTLRRVTFSGGGSHFLSEYMTWNIATFAKDPVFGNAKGYLAVMRARAKAQLAA